MQQVFQCGMRIQHRYHDRTLHSANTTRWAVHWQKQPGEFPYKLSHGNLFNLQNRTKRPSLAEQIIKGSEREKGVWDSGTKPIKIIVLLTIKQELLKSTFKSNFFNYWEGREVKKSFESKINQSKSDEKHNYSINIFIIDTEFFNNPVFMIK